MKRLLEEWTMSNNTVDEVFNQMPPWQKRRFDVAETIGEKLHDFMSVSDLTYAELAEKLHLSEPLTKKIVNGEVDLTLKQIAKIEFYTKNTLIQIP